MKTLSLAHVRRLNEAVLHLYGQITRGDFESAVISTLERLMPAESYMFGLLNGRTGRMTGRAVPDYENIEQITESFNRWGHQHPAIGRRVREAQSISQHLSRRDWHSRDLFDEAFRPYGMEDDLSLDVDLGGRVFLMLGTARNRRSYTREDRILMTLLGPHLCAAWHQSQAALRLPLPDGIEPGIGRQTVELNASGRVLACGAASNSLFRAYFRSDIAGSALPEEVRGWFLNQQTSSLRQPFHVRCARGHLMIHYAKDPTVSRYFLLLDEQPRPDETGDAAGLRGLGLSRREQEVLFWVAQGKTNATVARMLGISPGTVKRHLENIYPQLGVENRHGATLRALQSLQENRRPPDPGH